MTVAMALAEKLHHSAQRPRMARAGEWGREMNFTATIRDPLSEAEARQPLRRRAQRNAAGQDSGVGTGRGLEPIQAASLWRAHGGRGGRV